MASHSDQTPENIPSYLTSEVFDNEGISPSNQVSFQASKLVVKANNYLGSEEIPPKVKGYFSMLDFIKGCPVRRAIYKNPHEMCLHLLREFWWTCDYDVSSSSIKGTVMKGEHTISLSADLLRDVLRLPKQSEDRPFAGLVPTSVWKEWLLTIGYGTNMVPAQSVHSNPQKKFIPGVWRLLFTHVIQCLGGNSGSFDQATAAQMQMIYALANGRNIDFANVIFEDLKSKVTIRNRSSSVPFTRFLSLVFRHVLKEKYMPEGAQFILSPRVASSVYKVPACDPEHFDSKYAALTPAMQQVLFTMYPDVYKQNPAGAGMLIIPPASSKASKLVKKSLVPKRKKVLRKVELSQRSLIDEEEAPAAVENVEQQQIEAATPTSPNPLNFSLESQVQVGEIEKVGLSKNAEVDASIDVREMVEPSVELAEAEGAGVGDEKADDVSAEEEVVGVEMVTEDDSDYELGDFVTEDFQLDSHAEEVDASDMEMDEDDAAVPGEDTVRPKTPPMQPVNTMLPLGMPSSFSSVPGCSSSIPSVIEPQTAKDLGISYSTYSADRLERVEHQLNDLTKYAEVAVNVKENESERLISTLTSWYNKQVENGSEVEMIKEKFTSLAADQHKIKKATKSIIHDQQAIRSKTLSILKCANSTSYSAMKAASTSKAAAANIKKLSDQVNHNTKAIHALEKQMADLPIPSSFTEEDRQRQIKLEKEVDDIKHLLTQLVTQQSAKPATVEVVINNTTSKGEKVDNAVLDLVAEAVNKAVAQIYEDTAEETLDENVDEVVAVSEVPPAGAEGETEKEASIEAPPVDIEGEQQIVEAAEERSDQEMVRASWEAGFAERMAEDRSRDMLPIFHSIYLGNAEITPLSDTRRRQLIDSGFFKTPTADQLSVQSSAGHQHQLIDVLALTAEGKTQEDAITELDRIKQNEENVKKNLEFIRQLPLLEKDQLDGEQRMLLKSGGAEALYRQKHKEVEKQLSEKRAKFEGEKAKWLKLMDDRKRPQRIVAAEAFKADMGRKTNLKILREGVDKPTRLEGVKPTNLGASEWAEVYLLVKDRKAASYQQLQNMLKDYFEKALEYETKFKADLPMLRQIFGTPAAISSAGQRAQRKRKEEQRTLRLDLPPVSGDASLNTRLPPRSVFEEGRVLETPAGIFFTNFQNTQLFFRLDEIERASTGFLINIRRRCAETSNNRWFISKVDEELAKPHRFNDPAVQTAKQEHAWEFEAENL